MTSGRRAAVDWATVTCAPYLPELQRIVARCVGDQVAATTIVHEAVARVAAAAEPPPGTELRRLLFRQAHDVLLERTRAVRARGPFTPPSPVGTPPR